MEVLLPDEVLDPVLLLFGLDGDGVHAELPAVVPGALPVPLAVLAHCQPGEVVLLIESCGVNDPYKHAFNADNSPISHYIMNSEVLQTYFSDSCPHQAA